jgi:hypothetical protein
MKSIRHLILAVGFAVLFALHVSSCASEQRPGDRSCVDSSALAQCIANQIHGGWSKDQGVRFCTCLQRELSKYPCGGRVPNASGIFNRCLVEMGD